MNFARSVRSRSVCGQPNALPRAVSAASMQRRAAATARAASTGSRRARARILGREVVEVHADRHRPGDGGGAQPARPCRHRQRRHLDVARVPEPRAVRSVLRIEDPVVVDAVHGRVDAGDERRVRRIRDRRQHADHAVGPDAVARQAAAGAACARPAPGRCSSTASGPSIEIRITRGSVRTPAALPSGGRRQMATARATSRASR